MGIHCTCHSCLEMSRLRNCDIFSLYVTGPPCLNFKGGPYFKMDAFFLTDGRFFNDDVFHIA